MECTYTGQFDDQHSKIKKRRLTGKAKTNVVSAIVNDGKSSETYREFEAVRLMKSGIILFIRYLHLHGIIPGKNVFNLIGSLILFSNFPLIMSL